MATYNISVSQAVGVREAPARVLSPATVTQNIGITPTINFVNLGKVTNHAIAVHQTVNIAIVLGHLILQSITTNQHVSIYKNTYTVVGDLEPTAVFTIDP